MKALVMLACLLVLALGCSAMRSVVGNQPSVYEILQSYGFPEGLLPHTVVDYTLQANGKFALTLNQTCAAFLQGAYLVTYKSEISGKVTYGSIKSLKGVSVRAFFLDWTITGIRVANNDLLFEVGMASAKFPLSNFDESPECQADGVSASDS